MVIVPVCETMIHSWGWNADQLTMCC